jgi:hypothetical protein
LGLFPPQINIATRRLEKQLYGVGGGDNKKREKERKRRGEKKERKRREKERKKEKKEMDYLLATVQFTRRGTLRRSYSLTKFD